MRKNWKLKKWNFENKLKNWKLEKNFKKNEILKKKLKIKKIKCWEKIQN